MFKVKLSMPKVRAYCVEKEFYDAGTNTEYAHMLNQCNNLMLDSGDVTAIADDIIYHTDESRIQELLDECGYRGRKELRESVEFDLINRCGRTVIV